MYWQDSWKIKPRFNLTYGLGWNSESNALNHDLNKDPWLTPFFGAGGLGPEHRAYLHFSPVVGFAYSATKDNKTVIRGGIGLFYENAVWNNVLFDGPFREPTGAFLQTPSPCASAGSPSTIQTANGPINFMNSPDLVAVCGSSSGGFPLIGDALPHLLALQALYQADSPLILQQPNPNYAGQYLTECAGATIGSNCFFSPGNSMFNPNYKSPRSLVWNVGIQREIRPGMIVSVDFIRNVQTHFLLGVDQNHAGSTGSFNLAGANAAIAATLANCGAASVAASYSANCPTDPANGTTDIVNGVPTWVPRPTNMADFAGNGLGSSTDMGGNSCLAALGYNCAFGGINPNAPPMGFLSPVGRSEYNGLQMKWTDNVKSPFRGARTFNFQVSYALSRFNNSGGGVGANATVTASSGDQDFIVPALDNSNVNRYFGPSTLDRTHQLSFEGYVDLWGGFQVGVMSHFYSPLSTTLTVPNTGLGAGEIFRTDFTGSGVTQNPIPGTHYR